MVQSDSFWNIALQYQIILGWLTGIQVYNLLLMQYNLAAIVSTILGICKPEDWPPLFGSFRPGHFWSTRRLWGNVWHQMMRRQCNFWGGLVCDLTGAQRGTLRRRYTDLYAAFLFSVVIHGISSLNLRSKEHAIYQGLFFGMQPLMITLEDFVIFVGKSVRLRQNRKTSINHPPQKNNKKSLYLILMNGIRPHWIHWICRRRWVDFFFTSLYGRCWELCWVALSESITFQCCQAIALPLSLIVERLIKCVFERAVTHGTERGEQNEHREWSQGCAIIHWLPLIRLVMYLGIFFSFLNY